MVSDQELQGTVEPDMRQRQRDAFGRAFEFWWAEPDKADCRVRGILPVIGSGDVEYRINLLR